MESQQQIILDILSDNRFHCTSEFYAQYMADPRRRMCDLKDKGYELESRKCELHNFHRGVSKMWRLIANPAPARLYETTLRPVQSHLLNVPVRDI